MPDTLHLEIAGIVITVTAPEADRIFEPDPAKQAFIRSVQPGPAAIQVTIHTEPAPDPESLGMAKLFDTGPTWQMHRGETGYCMTVQPHPHEPAFWTLITDPGMERVVAHCGPNLVEMKNGTTRLPNPITYPMDQILLMHYLASRQGLVIHAAGLVANRQVFIFAGRSGAGKTSLARQLQAHGRLLFLSDDRILVRHTDDRLMAFGTPWPGEGGMAENTGAPVQALLFIVHGDATRITSVDVQTSLNRLLPVASIPWYDRDALAPALEFCEQLAIHVPAYDLHITPDIEVMDVIEDIIKG